MSYAEFVGKTETHTDTVWPLLIRGLAATLDIPQDEFAPNGVLPPLTGGYINYLYGEHGSLLTPDQGNPNTNTTNGAAFMESQYEAVTFALAQGTFVSLSPTYGFVIQPTPP